MKKELKDFAIKELQNRLLNIDGKDRNIQDLVLERIDSLQVNFIRTKPNQISSQRAEKLKNNIKKSALKDFDCSFEINKDGVDFISKNFKKDEFLVFEVISYQNQNNKINFSLQVGQDQYLVLNEITPVKITSKFNEYKNDFDKKYATDFNNQLKHDYIKKGNTRQVLVQNGELFQSFCDKVMNENAKMRFETGIVSYDLEDILTAEDPQSILNDGYFTLYYSVTDTTTRNDSDFGDVNPTRPPY